VVAEPFTNPPGYNSIGANVAMLKAGPRAHRLVTDRQGNPIDHRTATVQQFMETDTVFAGTPDDVVAQIVDFDARMGGVGHLLAFGQGGFLDHADTKENIRLLGQEVAPRLRALHPETARPRVAAAE
jgi:alkanesulfonate monooxygenase SsuD/methylene tetrahydromethanopterin reductase-like flavin-dependent oxidoreductase (luciferase family)